MYVHTLKPPKLVQVAWNGHEQQWTGLHNQFPIANTVCNAGSCYLGNGFQGLISWEGRNYQPSHGHACNRDKNNRRDIYTIVMIAVGEYHKLA
jgi:hypothetical protein